MANNPRQGKADATGNSIIDAVVRDTKPYKNTNYRVQPPIALGRGAFHVVTFKGEDSETRARFVFEGNGALRVYEDLRQLILDHGRAHLLNERMVLTLTVATSLVLSLGAMIWFGIQPNKPEAFQATAALVTLMIGYIFGVLGSKGGPVALEDRSTKNVAT